MKKLCACLAILLAVAIGYGQVDQRQPSQIVLTSPNGQRSITIMARDDAAGLWISCGKRVICVVDVDNYNAVGIYKNTDKTENGFDAYLTSP